MHNLEVQKAEIQKNAENLNKITNEKENIF